MLSKHIDDFEVANKALQLMIQASIYIYFLQLCYLINEPE